MNRTGMRFPPILISTIPLWLFVIDFLLDVELGEWREYVMIHQGLVLVAAVGLFYLLWRELTARQRAQETLRREHASLEESIRRRGEEYASEEHRINGVLEAIMENTRTMLTYFDTQFRFVRVNSAYVRSSGHTREELLGQNHFALFPNAENEAIFVRALDTGEPASFIAKPFDFPEQPWRGTTYWDWTLVPVKDASGSVCGMVFSLTDVTENHLAVKRREENLDRLEALIKVSERALGESTAEGLFQKVADAAREITGARISVAGYGNGDSGNRFRATSLAEGALSRPEEITMAGGMNGMFADLSKGAGSIRLTERQLQSHPAWRGLPSGHSPLRGLLGVRMNSPTRANDGFIMVSDKQRGDFSPEDDALLAELAALASLSLRHINAASEMHSYAARLDAIIEAMTDGVIVCDADGVVIRANGATGRLMGFDPTGSHMHSVLSRLEMRDDKGRRARITDLPSHRAMNGETVIDYRLEFTNVAGAKCILRASSVPLRLGGTVAGAVTIWSDETEREALLQQLEVERAKLQAIIDNAPSGIVVVDETGSIRMVNRAADGLQPYLSPAGSLVHGLHPSFLHRDGRPCAREDLPFTRSALHGEEFRNVELELRFEDGSHKHFLANSAPIRDVEGRINGAVGLFQDVTQQKHDEESFREREREYEILMEEAADGIVIINTHGVLLAANSQACRLVGYEREEILHREGMLFIPPEDLAKVNAAAEAGAGTGFIVEHRLMRKDGTLVHVETSARKISDGRYQAILRDITDRKKAEVDFARAIRTHAFDRLFGMLREFQHGEVLAMNLSRLALFARNLTALPGQGPAGEGLIQARIRAAVDEYQTITLPKATGIASLLRMVEQEMNASGLAGAPQVSSTAILTLIQQLESDARELKGYAEANPDSLPRALLSSEGARIADHAETLARKIRDISKVLNAHFTADASAIVRSVAANYRSNFPAIAIDIDDPSGEIQALIKPAEFGEALSLLLGNAIDALSGVGSPVIQRERRIAVRLMAQGLHAMLEVDDSGTGIPPSMREGLFDRGGTTKGEGHGHGLLYVKNLLDPYGGTVALGKTELGGACFRLQLVRV